MRTPLYVGLVIAAAGVGAALYFWPSIASALDPKTTGSIYVSGPQVYTRERLVNDRYREDTWLLNELTAAPKQKFGVTMSTAVTRADLIAIAAAAAIKAPAPTLTPTPASATNAELGKPEPLPAMSLDISPQNRLDALRIYREQIRTLMIENQLDDRHDLRGNSLYRLRFDATVLPGANTQTGARITLTVLPPEHLLGASGIEGLQNSELRAREDALSRLTSLQDLGPGEQPVWARVYARWLDSLTRRFEDNRKAIIRAYDSNQFTSGDYDRLLDAAKTEARQAWSAVQLRRDLFAKLRPDQRQAALRGLPDKSLDPSPQSASAWTAMRDKEASSDDVGTEDPGHTAYKREIERVIAITTDASALLSDLAVSTPTSPPVDKECGDLHQYGSLSDAQFDAAVPYGLRSLRDRVFEPSIFNTVLGLGPDTIQKSTVLAQFAHGVTSYGAPGPAFMFLPQVPSFTVTDKKTCFPDSIHASAASVTSGSQPIYFLPSEIDVIRLALPNYDPQRDIDRIVKEWTPIDHARVDTAFVDVGLINFIRMAGRRLDVFSYAFPPSEPDELNAIQSRDERSRMLAAEATAPSLATQASGRLNVDQDRAELRQRIATRKLVVSFGEQPNSATAKLGWIIQPQEPIEANRYRQRASQNALTALVSLPAWWEEVKVDVAVSWEGSAPTLPPQHFLVVLPVNFETIDASLFEANDRSPVINDWAMNGLSVTACQKTEITIPGRRLWRSTVVTLGGQRADGITVMPDMNGIVATFNTLDFPSTWTDTRKNYKAQLMVWTSQGSALPYWVTFKNSGQSRGCSTPTSASANQMAQSGSIPP